MLKNTFLIDLKRFAMGFYSRVDHRFRALARVRNNQRWTLNLLYWLHAWYSRIVSGVRPSAEARRVAEELRISGVAVIGKSDVSELRRKVKIALSGILQVDGFAQVPKSHHRQLVPQLHSILEENRRPIEAYFRSHFRVNWFEVQRITPGEQPAGSSFSYHTDDTPVPVIKLFIYLTDTKEDNGAFRAFPYRETDQLIRRGMLKSASPGLQRARAQTLVDPEMERSLRVVEGSEGTVFLFDNNLIHKGTLPRAGERIHVSMEIMPSPRALTLDGLLATCDRELTEYFPSNPFRA